MHVIGKRFLCISKSKLDPPIDLINTPITMGHHDPGFNISHNSIKSLCTMTQLEKCELKRFFFSLLLSQCDLLCGGVVWESESG